MKGTRKSYGRPRHRVAYTPIESVIADARLCHTEVVAGLEWLERGQMDVALDRLHLAYRFLHELLVTGGRVEAAVDDDEA